MLRNKGIFTLSILFLALFFAPITGKAVEPRVVFPEWLLEQKAEQACRANLPDYMIQDKPACEWAQEICRLGFVGCFKECELKLIEGQRHFSCTGPEVVQCEIEENFGKIVADNCKQPIINVEPQQNSIDVIYTGPIHQDPIHVYTGPLNITGPDQPPADQPNDSKDPSQPQMDPRKVPSLPVFSGEDEELFEVESNMRLNGGGDAPFSCSIQTTASGFADAWFLLLGLIPLMGSGLRKKK